MTGHIRYARLVNLGEYEHLRLEVEFEVALVTPEEVRQTVSLVEKWAGLAKRRTALERELRRVQDRIADHERWSMGEPPVEWLQAQAQAVEEATKQVKDLDAEW